MMKRFLGYLISAPLVIFVAMLVWLGFIRDDGVSNWDDGND